MSGLRIGPQLMDGLSTGRSPPRRKRKGKEAPVLFSSTFKALNLREKNSSTFKDFQGCVGTLFITTHMFSVGDDVSEESVVDDSVIALLFQLKSKQRA